MARRMEVRLAGQEGELRRFVETRMVDADGLVRDAVNVRTGKPFTKREAADVLRSGDSWERKADAPARFQPFTNYEDSDMATADYLVAQIFRYQVTGASGALAASQRCFMALAAIAGEGAKRQAGFLPKPYGGLAGASESGETSIDQYTKVVLALDTFSRTVAEPKQKRLARDLIVSFADYWERHNCTTMWFGSVVPWNGPHPNAALLYLMETARRLTGRRAFQRWFDLYHERRGRLWSWPFCSGNMASLIVRSMARLLQVRPEHGRVWLRAIRHNYRLASRSLHTTGYCRANPPRDQAILHGVSTQLASTAVHVGEITGTVAPLTLAARILLKTGGEGRVFHTRVLDPDAATATDRLDALKVSGYYMAGWQLAYWHRRWVLER